VTVTLQQWHPEAEPNRVNASPSLAASGGRKLSAPHERISSAILCFDDAFAPSVKEFC
jgi:hypothetical protein